MNTYANEIEVGDALIAGQTFKVADDSGLFISDTDYTLDSTHDVVHVEYGGTDFQRRELTRVDVRHRGPKSLLVSLMIPSARVVKTA